MKMVSKKFFISGNKLVIIEIESGTTEHTENTLFVLELLYDCDQCEIRLIIICLLCGF